MTCEACGVGKLVRGKCTLCGASAAREKKAHDDRCSYTTEGRRCRLPWTMEAGMRICSWHYAVLRSERTWAVDRDEFQGWLRGTRERSEVVRQRSIWDAPEETLWPAVLGIEGAKVVIPEPRPLPPSSMTRKETFAALRALLTTSPRHDR